MVLYVYMIFSGKEGNGDGKGKRDRGMYISTAVDEQDSGT